MPDNILELFGQLPTPNAPVTQRCPSFGLSVPHVPATCDVRETAAGGRLGYRGMRRHMARRVGSFSVNNGDMLAFIRSRRARAFFWFILAGGLVLLCRPDASALDVSPFEKLAGRWVGEGRLGVRDNATENVKCRVTYILAQGPDQLKQTIRCASASGSIEVRCVVDHVAGSLSGFWTELVRNMKGEIRGSVTPRGFRVAVVGEDLNANMDIIVLGAKQVIEIQFINSSLIGLTLILEKG
jgi:hypothetical protein